MRPKVSKRSNSIASTTDESIKRTSRAFNNNFSKKQKFEIDLPAIAPLDAVDITRRQQMIGKYEIINEIGRGSSAIVYCAFDTVDKRSVALKIIDKYKLDFRDESLVRTEGELLKSLRGHPNILECYDIFEDDFNIYMALELLEGGELLERIIHKSQYTEMEARDVITTLLRTVEHLHQQNIVHR
jgi:serine/threonine protein kinase